MHARASINLLSYLLLEPSGRLMYESVFPFMGQCGHR